MQIGLYTIIAIIISMVRLCVCAFQQMNTISSYLCGSVCYMNYLGRTHIHKHTYKYWWLNKQANKREKKYEERFPSLNLSIYLYPSIYLSRFSFSNSHFGVRLRFAWRLMKTNETKFVFSAYDAMHTMGMPAIFFTCWILFVLVLLIFTSRTNVITFVTILYSSPFFRRSFLCFIFILIWTLFLNAPLPFPYPTSHTPRMTVRLPFSSLKSPNISRHAFTPWTWTRIAPISYGMLLLLI